MKLWMTALAVVLTPALSQGQSAPTEVAPTQADPTDVPSAHLTQMYISLVLRDYYTIPYGMQLTVLANAARNGNGQIDANAVQQPLTDATMTIAVSDIKTGQTAILALGHSPISYRSLKLIRKLFSSRCCGLKEKDRLGRSRRNGGRCRKTLTRTRAA